MKTNVDKAFLQWLTNRLIYKYQEKDNQVLDRIQTLIKCKHIIDTIIDDKIVEKICKKYHADWSFDDSELNFGHSDESREQIRSHTKNIIKDYINEICFIG
jgi:hypothetical protein